MKFPAKFFEEELGLPWGDGTGPAKVLEDEECDTTRWHVVHRVIFQTPDQPENEAWSLYYYAAATENQEPDYPWANGSEVEVFPARLEMRPTWVELD